MNNRNCRNCGGPAWDKCEYCGTTYAPPTPTDGYMQMGVTDNLTQYCDWRHTPIANGTLCVHHFTDAGDYINSFALPD